MIPRIKPLPHWVLTDTQPAFYDTEAVTVLELLSKVYGKIEELVDDYNKYVEELDTKMNEQDQEIEEAIKYMKDNLIETVTNLYNEGFAEGYYVSLVGITYDDTNEELTIKDTLEKAEDEEY